MSEEQKFNILIGVVMASLLEHEEKHELIEFVMELEEMVKKDG